MIRQLPFIPTVLVVAAAGVMVWLGFWQLGRADEKEALIAKYEAALEQPLDFGSPNNPDYAFTRTKTYCSESESSEPIAGKNALGRNGWAHVVVCEIGGPDPKRPLEEQAPDFVIELARVVLGWSTSPEPIEWNGGMVVGTIVPARNGLGKIVADPPLAGLEPNAKPDPGDLPNNHLAYAGQWFFFALTALVIYFFAVRSKLANRD